MSNFINTYGGDLATGRAGMGSVNRALAAGLSINQIDAIGRSEGISFGTAARDYITSELVKQQVAALNKQMQSTQQQYQQQISSQAAAFQKAQKEQQAQLQQVQQQALEAETRQKAPEQKAQVLGAGKGLVIRSGGKSRFTRPELQIKSMNI